MSGQNSGQYHSHLKCSGNWFDRTCLPHIMQDVQDSIYWMWACIILLEKCCVHMPCSLNDWNDHIIQLLQAPLICYCALHKDQPNKALHANCIPRGCVFSEAQNIVFCLFTNPLRWKWASSLNHEQSKVAACYCTIGC